jgi:hypothetical protein
MPRIQIIVRSLLRNPGLMLSAILALALGIGANTALFTVISSLALHPYPLPEANRLIAVLEREPNDTWPRVAPADYFDLTHQSATFAAIAAWRGSFSTLTDTGATDQIWSVAVTEHLFSLLGSQPTIGRSLQPEDFTASAPRVILLSYRQWIDRFAGSPAVLGRTVSVDDEPYTVVGVMPKGFILPGYRRSDTFLPFRPRPGRASDAAGSFGVRSPDRGCECHLAAAGADGGAAPGDSDTARAGRLHRPNRCTVADRESHCGAAWGARGRAACCRWNSFVAEIDSIRRTDCWP